MSELDLRIVGGVLVVPEQGQLRAGVGIRNGRVVAVAEDRDLPLARRTIDAEGRYVIPGAIDPHVHLGNRSPYAGECATETRAALLGGVTTIGVFIRRTDSYLPHLDELIKTAEERIVTDLFFHPQIFTAEQVRDIPEYAARFGMTSFKMYMKPPGTLPYMEDGPLLEAFREVAKLGPSAVACVHTEVASMVQEALRVVDERVTEGTLADWCDTHPPEAEELAVIRAAYLAAMAGVPLYIVHITSAKAVKRLRELRRHHRIYVEVTSPSLSLTKLDPSGLIAKRLPPLRSPEDREALWEGVAEGVIDTFGTDNITETRLGSRVDQGWPKAKGGFSMLGTHLPVLLHEGYHQRNVPLRTLVEKACLNPAKIFGLYPKKGTIAPGTDADLVILDLEREGVVDLGRLGTFGDISPYAGRRLKGWPWLVVKQGEVAVEAGKIVVNAGSGRYLRRSLA